MALMRTCRKHHDYIVPLIFTFAFRGYELWCPYCDNHEPMLGEFDRTESNQELIERLDLYKWMAYPYISAVGTCTCDSLEWPKGSKTIILRNDLPAEELKRCQDIRAAGWKYRTVKIEDWMARHIVPFNPDQEAKVQFLRTGVYRKSLVFNAEFEEAFQKHQAEKNNEQ